MSVSDDRDPPAIPSFSASTTTPPAVPGARVHLPLRGMRSPAGAGWRLAQRKSAVTKPHQWIGWHELGKDRHQGGNDHEVFQQQDGTKLETREGLSQLAKRWRKVTNSMIASAGLMPNSDRISKKGIDYRAFRTPAN